HRGLVYRLLNSAPRARLDVDVLGPGADLADESFLTDLSGRALANRRVRGSDGGHSLARHDLARVSGGDAPLQGGRAARWTRGSRRGRRVEDGASITARRERRGSQARSS